jgi:hypothetical protein
MGWPRTRWFCQAMKIPRREERAGKDWRRIDCGMQEETGNFLFINLYKLEIMLEHEAALSETFS